MTTDHNQKDKDMQNQEEIIKTMAAIHRRTHHPERAAKTASAADQALEFRRATERGRRIIRGETDEENRGRKVMRGETDEEDRGREVMEAAKRGLRNFPPARQVVK
jgi:hypothetical protein